MESTRSLDGTTIGFERTGEGPPLLLVHGGVSDHTRWKPILPALERRFTVHAMDRRGRGGSGDGTTYAIEREFEDVAAVADAIGEPVNLLAHSFGAVCAIGAAKLTTNLRTLTLYEPPPVAVAVEGMLSPAMEARLQALMDRGDRAGVVTTFMREVVAIPPQELEMLQALPSWSGRVDAAHTILREHRALRTHAPYEPAGLTGLRLPVLLLVGGDSSTMYTGNTDLLHSMLPNSRIAVLPGQQHLAINTDPDLFTRTVLAFLDNPEA